MDSIAFMNLVFCGIITAVAVYGYYRSSNPTILLFGTGFAVFGVSHAAAVPGLHISAPLLMGVRAVGYILVVAGSYFIIGEVIKRISAEKKLRAACGHIEEQVGLRTAELKQANTALSQEIARRFVIEQELRQSEKKYREFFFTSRDGVFITTPDGKLVDFNQAVLEIFGYTRREELVDVSISSIYANPGLRTSIISRISSEGFVKDYPLELKKKDGSAIDALITSVPMHDAKGHITAFFGTLRDVTERKAAEEALRESEARLNSILKGSPMLQFVIDKDHRVISWNRAIEEYSGIREMDIIGTKNQWKAFYDLEKPVLADLLVDEVIERLPENYLGSIKKSRFIEGAYEVTDFFPKMGTSGKWLFFTAAPIRDSRGEIIGAVETLEDITERVIAEEELQATHAQLLAQDEMLRKSEKKYRSIFSTFIDLYYQTDIDGVIITLSPSCKTLTGWDPEDLIGHNVNEIYQIPDQRDDLVRQLLRNGSVHDYEIALKNAEGRYVPVSVNCHIIYDDKNKPERIEGTLRDITDRKAAEQALVQANKKISMLNNITRHDILNQLSGLRTYLELSKADIHDPEILAYIQREEQAAEAIEEQIEFTRNYQDIGAQAPQWQGLLDQIKTARKQLNLSGVEVVSPVGSTELFSDPLIGKVFYNLMENSLRHGGNVTRMEFSMEKSGKDLILVYRDNGIGIAAEDKSRLFRKGFGKHTGLGLFLSKEILSITGILISENGIPGMGARFEIFVPYGMWRMSGEQAA